MSFVASGKDPDSGDERTEAGFRTMDAAERWAAANLEAGWTVSKDLNGCC